MANFDIDTPVRINGGLTVNGDTSIPSSYNLYVGGNITGNSNLYITSTITGNTINGITANITNINSTGTISGGTIKGNGASLTVNGTTANGGTVPISNGWAYTHENKTGSMGHIPTGGSATTFLRGDNTWVVPTDTNNYNTGITSTSGGNGTLTVSRNGLSALTLDLTHNHDSSYYTKSYVDANKVSYGDALMNTNPFGGKQLYVNSVNNALFRADMRWQVTGGLYKISDGSFQGAIPTSSLAYMFNGSYEDSYTVPSGNYAEIDIVFNGGYFPNYPYGNIYISHYYTSFSTSISANGYCDYASQGIGWHVLPVSDYVNNGSSQLIRKVRNDYYDIKQLQFYVYAPSGNNAQITQIEFQLDRPATTPMPLVDKYQANTLYSQLSFADANKNTNLILGIDGTVKSYTITSSGNITANSFVGSGNQLTVSGTPSNGSSNPINAGWAYTHSNTYGLGSHVPTGGSATTFLRGDNTWVTPTDTNNYNTGISSTSGGNGTLTVSRNGLSSLTLDLTHDHNALYYTQSQSDAKYLGISGTSISANNSGKLNNITSDQFLRSDQDDTMGGILTISGSGATPLVLQRNGSPNVNLEFLHSSGSGFIGIDLTGQLKFGPVADLNASGYTVWHSNNFNPSNKLDVTTFNTHTGNTGIGSHIPTGGSNSQFLRGDGTWVVPTDTYVSGLSSTSGGNGTLTVSRNSGSNLTLDLSHNHDSSYYTKSQIDTQMSGKDYYGKWNLLAGATTTGVTASANITVTGNGATTVSLVGNTLTVSSTDTNTWRGIDTSPVSGDTTNSIASSWAYTHANSYGMGYHVPTGGSATTFLRGDNTWVVPTDTNNYDTGISSTSGGNGTLTISRNGLTALTLDLTHNHDASYYSKAQIDTQMSGKDYYGKWNMNVGGTAYAVNSSGNITVTGNGATSVSMSTGTITISSTDTNTWRPVDDTPINGNSGNSASSNWAYDHANSYGLGYHVPTGGTSSNFLRGDGTWVVPTDTNNYVTSISGGGNSTFYLNRNGLTQLTLDLSHNHDTSYYTKSQIDTQMGGKDYYGKWNLLVGGTTNGVTSSANITVTGNGATSVSYAGGTLTISSTDNNTWRPVDTTPTSGDTANSISSDWAYQHVNSYGLGSHVPTGGNNTNYLRGDGTWQTIATVDTYVTGLSASSGGNGILTVSQNQGQTNLTVDLTHNHDTSYYTKSLSDGRYLGISGTAYNSNMLGGISSNAIINASGNYVVWDTRSTNTTPYIGDKGVRFDFKANSTDGLSDGGTYHGVMTFQQWTDSSGGHTNQLAFTDNGNLFSRTAIIGTGNTWGAWNKIWHSGNMGAGSGLNADMVDSIQGSSLVRNDTTNQVVDSGFTMSGNAYVGGSASNGALYIRSGTGTTAIQLAGDNSAQASGVKIYMNASGNANFGGTVSANALVIASNSLVTNLNAQMLNGIKEPQITKNQSINDLGGKGVQTGMLVSAQSVPNMTVQIANGTAYTDSGMRIVVSSATNVSFSSPSATYNRIDSVYIQGSSAGANEGVITVSQGTASASPVAPSIPSDGILLANVTIRQNAGSILATDIADMRWFKPVYTSGSDVYATNKLFVQGSLDSTTNGMIAVNKPFQLTNSATNLKIASGNTSTTWTHNLNLSKYAVTYSWDNPEPHVYWSNKSGNSIVFNLDDVCNSDVNIDIILVALS